MRLSCPSCASPVEYDAAGIRRGYVFCDACDTLARIDEDGLKTGADRPEELDRPDSVRVDRDGDDLTIRVRPPAGRRVLYLPELLIGLGAVIVPAGGLLCWEPELLCTVCNPIALVVVGFMALLVALFIGSFASKLRSWLPPLKLRDGTLKWWVLRPHRVDTDRIRQLFVTRVTNEATRIEGVPWVSLTALMDNGRRRVLLGTMQDPEDALYVEAVLENELGLFDLAVEGEAADKEHAIDQEIDLDTIPDTVDCGACGAGLQVDDAARKRGVITCGYCQGLTLLYTSDGAPVLGQGGWFARVYDTIEDGDRLVVQRLGDEQTMLEASPAGLVVREQERIPADRVEGLEARELSVDDPLGRASRFFERWEDAIGRSGELPGMSEVADEARRIFAVFAVLRDGEQRPVLGSIEDDREAAMLAADLRAALGR